MALQQPQFSYFDSKSIIKSLQYLFKSTANRRQLSCCGFQLLHHSIPALVATFLWTNRISTRTRHRISLGLNWILNRISFSCVSSCCTSSESWAPTTCSLLLLLMAKELHFSMHFLQINFLPTTLTWYHIFLVIHYYTKVIVSTLKLERWPNDFKIFWHFLAQFQAKSLVFFDSILFHIFNLFMLKLTANDDAQNWIITDGKSW